MLTATLVWADPPGTPAAPALDPPDLMLVNDLDLRITRGANSVTPPPPVGSGFLIDEDFSGGMPAGWSVVTSQGVSWSIKTPVPGD